jgi:hypothetical protein
MGMPFRFSTYRSSPFSQGLAKFKFVLLSPLLALAGCQLSSPVIVRTSQNTESPGLVVTGTAMVRVKPTLVILRVGVTSSGARPGSAKQQTEAKVSRIAAAIRGAGIAPADLQTDTFNLNQVYDRDRNPTGWACTSNLQIRVKRVESAAAVLEAAVDAGADQVSRIEYTVEELQEVRRQARDEACKVAVDKAKQYAKNFGVSLGKPISISENPPRGWYYGHNTVTAQSVSQSAGINEGEVSADQILSSGSVGVTLTVSVTYSL